MSTVNPALIQVSKRNKSREPLNLEKLHKKIKIEEKIDFRKLYLERIIQ